MVVDGNRSSTSRRTSVVQHHRVQSLQTPSRRGTIPTPTTACSSVAVTDDAHESSTLNAPRVAHGGLQGMFSVTWISRKRSRLELRQGRARESTARDAKSRSACASRSRRREELKSCGAATSIVARGFSSCSRVPGWARSVCAIHDRTSAGNGGVRSAVSMCSGHPLRRGHGIAAISSPRAAAVDGPAMPLNWSRRAAAPSGGRRSVNCRI